MTDPHANFIAAILARPGDDLMRTAYADFLEWTEGSRVCTRCRGGRVRYGEGGFSEHECEYCHGTGEVSNGHAERASFIRCQVDLAQLIGDGSRCPVCDWPIREDGSGCQPDNCSFRPGEHTSEHARWLPRQKHFHALRRRERELQHIHAMEWIEPQTMKDDSVHWHASMGANVDRDETARWWQGWSSGNRYIDADFRRGFVEAITCSWQDWQRHAAAIRRATPLREMTFTSEPPDYHACGACKDCCDRLPKFCDRERERLGLPADITLHLPTTSHRHLQPAGR